MRLLLYFLERSSEIQISRYHRTDKTLLCCGNSFGESGALSINHRTSDGKYCNYAAAEFVILLLQQHSEEAENWYRLA